MSHLLSTVGLRRRSLLLGAAAGLASFPLLSRAAGAELDKIKYSLDFRLYGETAPNVYGLDLGLFRDLGIDATMDGSQGSVDSITRVASGTYDFGVADVNSLVEFASRNPDMAPKFVCAMFDRSASAVVSLKKKGITKLADLEGRTLGVSSADAGSRLLPTLLRLNGVDESKIKKVVIDPKLRNTMMVKEEVDAVVGQNYTVMFDVGQAGVMPADLNIINYSDAGFDVYAQGLIVSRKIAESNPDLVRRVALAFVRSWKASIRDPGAAVQSAAKRDRLTNVPVETARLKWLLDNIVVTPNTKANGIGAVDPARLGRAIDMISKGFELSKAPTVADIYDARFMPSLAERKL